MFADIDPVTLNLDPDAAAAAVTERTTRAAAGAHLRLPRRPGGVRATSACRSSRTRARRSARSMPTAFPSGDAGIRPRSRFYANKQLTTGEGGMVTTADGEVKERIDSERNQGRAPNMDWLDHDRLGFNYRLSEIACALGLAQLERLDEMLAGRARVAVVVRLGARRDRGSSSCPADGGRPTCAEAGSCTWSSCHEVSTAMGWSERSATSASRASRTSPPCI